VRRFILRAAATFYPTTPLREAIERALLAMNTQGRQRGIEVKRREVGGDDRGEERRASLDHIPQDKSASLVIVGAWQECHLLFLKQQHGMN